MSSSQCAGSSAEPLKSQQFLLVCEQAFAEEMGRGFNALAENAIERFYTEAETSSTSDLQFRYQTAARILARSEERLKKQLLDEIHGMLTYPRRRHLQPPEAVPQMTLIADEVLAERLALENIITRAEVRFQTDLFALNARLSALIENEVVTDENNPFGPRVYCESLARCIATVDLDAVDRETIYREAYRPLMSTFSRAYRSMNEFLAKSGVLPEIEYKPLATDAKESVPVAASQISPTPTEPHADSSEPAADEASTEEDTWVVLTRILSMMGRSDRSSDAPARGPALTVSDLDQGLALMQADRDETGLLAHLMNIAESTGRSVDPMHRRTIELFVSVQTILEEKLRATTDAGDLFAQLRPTIARVALADPSFFVAPEHPARRFVEAIADFVQMSDEDSLRETSLWSHVESLVRRASEGFNGDMDVFDQSRKDLESRLKRFLRGARLREKRHIAAQEGKEKRAIARTDAERCISELVAKYEPEPLFRSFLEKAWVECLTLSHLRGEQDNDLFADAAEIARFVCLAGSGKSAGKVASSLLARIGEVTQTIEQGLAMVGYGYDTADAISRRIEDALKWSTGNPVEDWVPEWMLSEFEAHSLPSVDVDTMRVGRLDINIDLDSVDSVSDVDIEKVLNLPPGTWLRIEDSSGVWRKAKLSWFSVFSGRCLLVNASGSASETTLEILISGFLSGTVLPIVEGELTLFEQALYEVWRRMEKGLDDPTVQ